MSDSDEEVPLASLKRSQKTTAMDEDSEDDVPLSSLTATKRKSTKKVDYTEKDEDEFDDDFVPAKKAKSTKSPAKKAPTPSKAKSASMTTDANTCDTKKHELVEKILRRWTTCMPEWPDDSVVETPPKGYIEMGFKGVYVGVRGDATGLVRDNRNLVNNLPSKTYLLTLPAEELKEMALKGIKQQMADLEATALEHVIKEVSQHIKQELIQVNKLKPSSVDSEYAKYLRRKN